MYPIGTATVRRGPDTARPSIFRRSWRAAALLCALVAAAAPAQEGRAPLQQEYFLRQSAGEGMLVRVNAREATIRAQVGTLDEGLLLRSTVNHSRIAPLFQFIDAPDRSRQLDIEVNSDAYTDRSTFELEVVKIAVRDERSALLARAYELLSFGLEEPPADTAANWSVKIDSLSSSARVFGQFGMEELRLWARFHGAALVLRELGDLNLALDLARELGADPGIRRHADIAIAVGQLEIEAMAAVLATAGDSASARERLEFRSRLADAMAAARFGDWAFEEAAAERLLGGDLDGIGEAEGALAAYRRALAIADRIGADGLATEIREALVELHGEAGDVAATQEVLQAIEVQLSEEGGGDELAQNLLAQGRLLNRSHRYVEAAEVLTRALGYERNSATRAQLRLALAEALLESGRSGEAMDQVRAAIVSPDSGEFRRATSVLDVAAGLSIGAAAQRHLGDHQAVERMRAAQQDLLGSAAERQAFAYDRILDAVARGDLAAAGRRARGLVEAPAPWGPLAVLQQCALGTECSPRAARAALDRLADPARPRTAAEARYLWARFQRRVGDDAGALAALDALVDEVAFLRHRWSGFLGEWYWRRRDELLDEYLGLSMTAAAPQRALLSLAKARFALDAERSSVPPLEAEDAAFRERLARHAAQSVNGGADLRRSLEEQRRDFRAGPSAPDEALVTAYLVRLGDDEVLLDFCFCAGRAWLLEARSSGVRRHALAGAGALRGLLEEVANKQAILEGDAFAALMDRAGRALLEPVADRLPRRIRWIGSGVLARIPPAALRLDGAFLARGHELLEVTRFPHGSGVVGQGMAESPRVFLAGEPRDYSGDYLSRLESSAELRAVTDRFVGPGLTLVQGNALLRDEFEQPAFLEAELVHWAMPALVDWSRPQDSGVQLSEPGRGAGRQTLDRETIDGWRLQARLLVLSQCDQRGLPRSDLSSRPPLLSALIDAGAEAVLASAWPGSDRAAARFAERFYRSLLEQGDPAAALAAAQRLSLADGGSDWARYRLFIR